MGTFNINTIQAGGGGNILQAKHRYFTNHSTTTQNGHLNVSGENLSITLDDSANYILMVAACQAYAPSSPGNIYKGCGLSTDGTNVITTGTSYYASQASYSPGREGTHSYRCSYLWAPGSVGAHTIYFMTYTNTAGQASKSISFQNKVLEVYELAVGSVTSD